jgi:hypothetical protein
MRPLTFLALGALAGCAVLDPTDDALELCAPICAYLYIDADGCGIQRPGRTQQENEQLCLDECQAAAAVDGEVGDYDPWAGSSPADIHELENLAQVELWIECVEGATCEELADGLCPPIW